MYSFIGVRAAKIMNGVGAFRAELISSKALCVFLSCLEAGAANEARSHVIRQKTGKVRPPATPTDKQVSRVAGAPRAPELRQLDRAGLITRREGEITVTETLMNFAAGDERRSAARLIPVPREMLRALISEKRPALMLTALIYFLYGLSFERGTGQVKRAGAVKATTIAELTGLSERAVRMARAELISRGWISKDESSHQMKLNRTGAYFVMNCDWKRGDAAVKQQPRSAQAVENLAPTTPEFAPPQGQNSPKFAPPIKRLEIKKYKNQKAPVGGEAGFCKKGEEGGGDEPPPNIRNVKLIDLKKPLRLEALYRELAQEGKIEATEAAAVNFAAAAIRAGTLPELCDERRVKVFLGIVKRRLWANITQAEEDRALAVIRRCRERRPEFLRAA